MIVFLDGGAESDSYLFQAPLATLVHAEGAFWYVEGESKERVEDPAAWLKHHAQTRILAGFLGFEFGYLTQGLKELSSLPQDNLLCVGIFDDCRTESLILEDGELDLESVDAPDRDSYLESVAAARSAIYRGDFFRGELHGKIQSSLVVHGGDPLFSSKPAVIRPILHAHQI